MGGVKHFSVAQNLEQWSCCCPWSTFVSQARSCPPSPSVPPVER